MLDYRKILGEEVEIIEIIPTEFDRTHEKACYSSDLLMRQLSRERAFAKNSGKNFSYKQLKKVYTIVLMEKSPSAYWQYPNTYIHHGSQKFDSGLELELLQEYYMVSLDVFKEIPHNNLSKLEAWLYFIGSDSPKDIYRVIEAYPEFKEFYNELLMLRYQVRELIQMYDVYREALQAADLGTVEYMIEERELELEKKTAELQEKDAELQEKDAELQEKDAELQEKISIIQNQEKSILELQQILQKQQEQIDNLKRLVTSK